MALTKTPPGALWNAPVRVSPRTGDFALSEGAGVSIRKHCPMPFTVFADVDDHLVSATAESAKEAFAKAVEWQVVRKLADVTISDGIKHYSIDEFSSIIANDSDGL
ncbi:hypothetical protein JQ609_04225 [Bradyrhizobium sp. AUGA SZCCT0169]|uniref:hypothetical protein n=1 Tax=Bradyrhizobium sp. AUGA SZCCT0169 TaxID=2807663 RepID=UPI001BABE418|nr:hypothetical protein [Bradyrhizobium sp. AUGA SZCCT0169]MBR1246135.1 hypothetical protein [Bradyrhizobium sp. AUGA SZCCT0169]